MTDSGDHGWRLQPEQRDFLVAMLDGTMKVTRDTGPGLRGLESRGLVFIKGRTARLTLPGRSAAVALFRKASTICDDEMESWDGTGKCPLCQGDGCDPESGCIHDD